MQLSDVLCYIVLTITVTASCVRTEEQNTDVEEIHTEKRLSKRETTLILNNYAMDRIFQKPKVIYRRISKQRYGPAKSKYGSSRPKYGPPKATRKPGKKAQKSKPKPTAPKYGSLKPSFNKKRASKPKPKPRYGLPTARPNVRPNFGQVAKMPHYSYFVSDNTGFGEPPVHYMGYQQSKQSYGEPPVDSYGVPIKNKDSIRDVHSTPHTFQETSQIYDDFNGLGFQWNVMNKHTQKPDTKIIYTKKQPTYSLPSNAVYVTPALKDFNDDAIDSDVTERPLLRDNKFFFRKKRPFYFDDSKIVNNWMPNKQEESDDEVIVGGQYAEPPARYVARYQSNSPMYEDDEDEDTFVNPLHGYVDTDVALSANNSPYSNYKHSNMAFSPQNLNDAFSIIDK